MEIHDLSLKRKDSPSNTSTNKRQKDHQASSDDGFLDNAYNVQNELYETLLPNQIYSNNTRRDSTQNQNLSSANNHITQQDDLLFGLQVTPQNNNNSINRVAGLSKSESDTNHQQLLDKHTVIAKIEETKNLLEKYVDMLSS